MVRLRILLVATVFLIISASVSVIDGSSKKKTNKKPHHLAYFYDLKTNRTLKPPLVSFEDDEEYQLKAAAPIPVKPNRPNFGRRCDCQQNRMANVCSCCAGLTLPRIGFQREMCTRFQYNQRNQMLMDVTMNGNSIAQQTVNVRAPDLMPLCVPLPIPFIPLRFDFCIKVFDVNFMGQNAHFCMDWSARVEMAPLILLHFDCAQFGSDGISLLKPGQSAAQPGGGFPSVLQPEIGGGGSGVGGTGTVVGGGGGGGGVGGGGLPGVVPIESGGSGTAGGTGGGSTIPQTPSQPITTDPATGPDENGNLPQVGGGDGDFDQVDDLKLKVNTTRYNHYHYYNNRV